MLNNVWYCLCARDVFVPALPLKISTIGVYVGFAGQVQVNERVRNDFTACSRYASVAVCRYDLVTCLCYVSQRFQPATSTPTKPRNNHYPSFFVGIYLQVEIHQLCEMLHTHTQVHTITL